MIRENWNNYVEHTRTDGRTDGRRMQAQQASWYVHERDKWSFTRITNQLVCQLSQEELDVEENAS